MDLNNLVAITGDGEGVLGKIVYYSLSSILVDRDNLEEICDELEFPYTSTRRVAHADAFRSATGDIYDKKTVSGIFGPETFKIYCRDNKAEKGMTSRELVKETLGENTNTYKKLANITYSKGDGLSFSDLVYDSHVDPFDYCNEAMRLYELYQVCVGRKQIETMLETYIGSLNAAKLLAHGKMYFVPRDRMAKLDDFELLIQRLEEANQQQNAYRYPLDANSMYVVDDEKQRKKMAAAFYNSVRREIAECTERANYFIQSDSQSPAVMERWALKIQGLKVKKREYEDVLRRELTDLDGELDSLGYLADELAIRARGLHMRKAAA